MAEKKKLLLAPGETAEDWVYDRGNPQGAVTWSFVQAQRRIGYELGRESMRKVAMDVRDASLEIGRSEAEMEILGRLIDEVENVDDGRWGDTFELELGRAVYRRWFELRGRQK